LHCKNAGEQQEKYTNETEYADAEVIAWDVCMKKIITVLIRGIIRSSMLNCL
jgi:hypothetical protein